MVKPFVLLAVCAFGLCVALEDINSLKPEEAIQSQLSPDDADIIKSNIKIITGSPVKKPSKSPSFTPSPVTRVPTSSPVITTDYSCVHANAWLVNTNNQYSTLYTSTVDIKTSSFVNTSATSTGWKTTFSGIPFYGHVFTQAEVNSLNSRPKAATDFVTGQTTAVAGQYYDFGANIGYSSTKCTQGYWPTGPDCPIAYSGTYTFPVLASPEANSDGCYIPMHPGYYVNGVPFWSWSDTDSYNNEEVWYNAAMKFEQYDMDVCLGHSGSDTYHHHSVSPCLMTQLNDTGAGHSPVHGFANDGYPVYGPYQAAGKTLAVSCWTPRDYSSPVFGCAGGGRTCQFVDPYDYTQGTFQTTSAGPLPNGTVTTQSDNIISAASGCYFEDFYYDPVCGARGGAYLDSHNGHSHGSYGYHYHATMDSNSLPTFPYTVGPKFYGCHDGLCESSPYGGGTVQSSCLSGSMTQKAGACTKFLSTPAISYPTMQPSAPLISGFPTVHPSRKPTELPSTIKPSRKPSTSPVSPTVKPSFKPTKAPASTTAQSISTSDVSVEENDVVDVDVVSQTNAETESQEISTVIDVVQSVVTSVRKLLRGFTN